MTRDEARERLITLAGMVALESAARQAPWTVDARIPWALITEIRETLPHAGIDYERARKVYEEKKRLHGLKSTS